MPIATAFIQLLSLFTQPNGLNTTVYEVLLIALSIAYLYVMFSVFMFAARMLESNFQDGIANRRDSLKAFFCIWIFPLGVWYIQPAVQQVLAHYESNTTSTVSIT